MLAPGKGRVSGRSRSEERRGRQEGLGSWGAVTNEIDGGERRRGRRAGGGTGGGGGPRAGGGRRRGAGGLARAYARSAKDALDAAGVSAVRRWVVMEAPCPYARFEEVRREVARFGGVEERVDYGADVLLRVLIPEERSAQFGAHLFDLSAGTIEALEAGEAFRAAPIDL